MQVKIRVDAFCNASDCIKRVLLLKAFLGIFFEWPLKTDFLNVVYILFICLVSLPVSFPFVAKGWSVVCHFSLFLAVIIYCPG